MYHPNVYSSGNICLNVIQTSAYSPAATLEMQMNNILLLRQDPNPNSPANSQAASDWRQGLAHYKQAVRKHMSCYFC